MTGGLGKIKIREASDADLSSVQRIEIASFTDPWSLESLWGELCPDAMRAPLVAEIEGQVCGYLMAWQVVDQLHILNVATDPNFLRRGVGRGLLLTAARKAQTEDLLEITLEVRRSNQPARAFYSGFGFLETGVRPGYYPETGEDAIIMTAPVSSVLARS